MKITTIGLDLAKSIFQVHGVDATGQVVVRKSLRRSQMLPFFAKLPSCLIGIEACGTSHHWARELIKLGHEVRLMPPAYVKPYVKRGKTDAADAEAVCEAVTRPTMRFVPVKSPEQQAALSMHRTRDLLVKQRTQLINMIRGLLAEFGVDIPKGLERALLMARQIVDGRAPDVPIEAAKIVGTLSRQALDTHVRLREIDRDLLVWQRGNDVARRLMTIPGIGPVGATALAASVTNPHQFRSGRQFAAWLGLTPLQKSSGGKERLGRITKMGDKYLRKLLIVGMTSLVRRAKYNPATIDPRLADLLARKPTRVDRAGADEERPVVFNQGDGQLLARQRRGEASNAAEAHQKARQDSLLISQPAKVGRRPQPSEALRTDRDHLVGMLQPALSEWITRRPLIH